MTKRSIFGPPGGGVWTAEDVARRDRRIADLSATDPQFAAAMPDPRVSAALARPGQRLAQVVRTMMEGYADRPALASRAVEQVKDPESGRMSLRFRSDFETVTYGQLWERATAAARGLAHDEKYPLQAGDRVCSLGFTGVDYVTIEIALTQVGAISIPLLASLSPKQLSMMLAESQPAVLAVDIENLAVAVQMVLTGAAPKRLVLFSYRGQVDDHRDALAEAREQLTAVDIVVETLGELIERGRILPEVELPDGDESSTALVIYTSGSTGTPKGAMHSRATLARMWSAPSEVPIITVHYLPLSHVGGLGCIYWTLSAGGLGYFIAKSDMSTLIEDFATVRPTMSMVVGRIWDLMIADHRRKIDQRVALGEDPAAADRAVKVDFQASNRFIDVFTIGSPELLAVYESIIDTPLTVMYGSTELGGQAMINGVVRCPPVTGYKLADVPELGYFCTDRPYPRGELCVKSDTLFTGYYERPEASASVFDAEGFYKTADIFAEISPGQFQFVDRRNDVFKLAQQEFVSASQVEQAYVASSLIDQIYIYGNHTHASVSAVIVPSHSAMERACGDQTQLKHLLGEALREIAKRDALQPYEIPSGFLIETEPFSIANGLVGRVGKIARAKLKERYSVRLEQLYAQVADNRSGELEKLRQGVEQRPVLQTVLGVAAVALGIPAEDLHPDLHFTDLGGDSVSAMALSNHLGDIFGLEVPVSVVIHAANDLAGIARHIEGLRSGEVMRATFSSVHGANVTKIHVGELTLDRFIDAELLAAASALPGPNSQVRTVLLTGANGFLGRFLALEWMRRVAPSGGKVVAVVRGKDDANAHARLDDAFTSGEDDELTRRYRELSAEHIEVLAGDLGEPRLGLDQATWDRLAREVDLVFHNGALVNHILPYQQLFAANVAGTAELVGLALTTKLKRFAYVSTMGVPMLAAPPAQDEDADMRVAAVHDIGRGSYGDGYGISKWAGEVLAQEAHDLVGLPVTIVRPDMILAPENYSGQFNPIDVLTRMLFSVLVTGIAPRSFYPLDPDGIRVRGHYDGMPADFMAEAMVTLSLSTDGIRGFNVSNQHDDGVGLDQFIDWLIEAGHPITRIDDYDEWLCRIETAVRALPEQQRRRSMLLVLDHYRRRGDSGDGLTLGRFAGVMLPNEKFRAAVQSEKVGAHGDIPHLTKDWLLKYATDMKRLGWV